MAFSASEVRRVIDAACQLPFDSAAIRVEDFYSKILSLNPAQQGQHFPNPDPKGLIGIAVGNLTGKREALLRNECTIPNFAVYQDTHGANLIAGLDTYLATQKVDPKLRARLAHHQAIRTALRRIRSGHQLEAVGAAIMNASCDYGEATRGSGDQGIDAIGWRKLIFVDPCFSDGESKPNSVLPGEKVFLYASSKAFTDGRSGPPNLISPAHIRELVGGWVIQRSSAARWQSVGIRMMSPVQMILITTYRLSDDAKAECRSLGVQVWGIPELIYLICSYAPDSVFDTTANELFLVSGFKSWWELRDKNRLMAV